MLDSGVRFSVVYTKPVVQPPQFSIVVNDTEPIFFYCSAPGACIQDGMIGVINPNSTQTLEAQTAYAENSTLMFSPGEGYPSETQTTASSVSQTTSPSSPPKSIALTSGAISGIVIGSIAMMLLVGILLLICKRKKNRTNYLQNAPPDPPSYISQSPFQQHPDTYHDSREYPPTEDDFYLSPLSPPSQNRGLPTIDEYRIPPGGLHSATYAPQELAAPANMQLSRPFSFDHSQETLATKTDSI
ncbi:hypothetical protein ACMFMG_012035 [Clarireedia jacksonii]